MPRIPHRDPRGLARKKASSKRRSFLPSGEPNFKASVPFFGAPGKQNSWYNRKWWKTTRKRVLEAEPVCQVCLLRGRLSEAIDVDHILPHQGDYETFHDATNLWALCKSCHARKSFLEGQGEEHSTRQQWAMAIAKKGEDSNEE